MGLRYVNIMVFTKDLWFLSGSMTTVLLQTTLQVCSSIADWQKHSGYLPPICNMCTFDIHVNMYIVIDNI